MCFRCVSEDNFIEEFPKLDTLDKKNHWNTEKPKVSVYRKKRINKMLENSTDKSDSQKICASMKRMYSNAKRTIIRYGDIPQLTNWILESGATFHMTPEISYFILVLLVETDKYVEVADNNFITVKQKGEVQIETRDDNGRPFIDKLYKLILEPDLCNQLFSIAALINLRRT